MKHIIILGDGMADWPVKALGGKTLLQAAATPYMDKLARMGRVGRLVTVAEGFHPGSEVANMSVLGYNLPKAVVKPRVSAREDFKYLLQIEIGQLDGSWNKTANLEAWWSIADASGNLLVQQKSSLSVPLGNGYDDLVRAESRLLAELSAQIAPAFARQK